MKFSKEKRLYYSLLAAGKLKEAKKVEAHLLSRILKRKKKGKNLTAYHTVK